MDSLFASEYLSEKSPNFIFTRGDNKFADLYRVMDVPAVIVTAPDGDELSRGAMQGVLSIGELMDEALKKYVDTSISWKSDVAEAEAGKLLVVGFDDEKGEGLKALENKAVVKYHERCTFVKLAYEKGSDLAKKWGVTSVPTVILCDPSKEDPSKEPFEKLSGKRTPKDCKEAIRKALKKLDTPKK